MMAGLFRNHRRFMLNKQVKITIYRFRFLLFRHSRHYSRLVSVFTNCLKTLLWFSVFAGPKRRAREILRNYKPLNSRRRQTIEVSSFKVYSETFTHKINECRFLGQKPGERHNSEGLNNTARIMTSNNTSRDKFFTEERFNRERS